MPFTLAHPAAAVPLTRRGLVLSALVAGSMAPDFQYFMTQVPGLRDWVARIPAYNFSHTLPGLFLFCLPAGIAVLWLYHRFLKLPILSLLPPSHQVRLLPLAGVFSFGPWGRFALILISLLLGAVTHVLWDSFTHSYGWFVQSVPLLTLRVFEAGPVPVYLFTLLQHGCTLVGMALLGYWYWRWFQQPVQAAVPAPFLPEAAHLRIPFAIGITGLLLAGIYRFPGIAFLSDLHAFRFYVGQTVVTGMLILFLELLVFSALWHFTRYKERDLR